MNNKQTGNDFEKRVRALLAEKGWWVHFITPDKRGAQPFDIIAVKSGMARAIECKTLADNRKYFPLSRLEENQIYAFERWIDCGNEEPEIWVEHKGEIKIILYSELKGKEKIEIG